MASRVALKLANLKPDEVLYDLGAGDGRVLFIARRDFGARAVGIEVGPIQGALIWLRSNDSSVSCNAKGASKSVSTP
jgi:cyclopropane fatty-acyl-phospholipid synthase-like methyltransferase